MRNFFNYTLGWNSNRLPPFGSGWVGEWVGEKQTLLATFGYSDDNGLLVRITFPWIDFCSSVCGNGVGIELPGNLLRRRECATILWARNQISMTSAYGFYRCADTGSYSETFLVLMSAKDSQETINSSSIWRLLVTWNLRPALVNYWQ